MLENQLRFGPAALHVTRERSRKIKRVQGKQEESERVSRIRLKWRKGGAKSHLADQWFQRTCRYSSFAETNYTDLCCHCSLLLRVWTGWRHTCTPRQAGRPSHGRPPGEPLMCAPKTSSLSKNALPVYRCKYQQTHQETRNHLHKYKRLLALRHHKQKTKCWILSVKPTLCIGRWKKATWRVVR